MYSFKNDYSEGAHPHILQAFIQGNLEQNIGYGEDIHCQNAAKFISEFLERPEAEIHFLVGGSQTNLTSISAFLRPHQGVISAYSGHINTHETGSVEATGHKILTRTSEDGKVTPAMVQSVLDEHTDEHMVQPKLVYISNSTEIGTIYSKRELEALHHICKRNNLYLYMDGARLGSALTARTNDLELKDIAALVDAFYIGGTKNGALCGEALVICNSALQEDFRFLIKQKGALTAKGFLLGIQFEQLFQNNLFFEMASHANEMADRLREGMRDGGFSFFADSPTNQIFPILPYDIIHKLEKEFEFYIWAPLNQDRAALRLVTSWATKPEAVEQFIELVKRS